MGHQHLIVITNGNQFARMILDDVLAKYAGDIAGIVIITGDYKGMTGLPSLWALSREMAWPYLIYKIFSMLIFILARLIHRGRYLSVEVLAQKLHIPVVFSNSIKSERIVGWIKEREPELIISVSCPQLIGKGILDLSARGGINIHSSLLPAYAGLAPYYWVLSNNEAETGITVHYMTTRFDVGNILVQKRLPIESGESAFHLFYQLAELGRSALLESVKKALEGYVGVPQNLENRSYYSNPDFQSYQKLKANKFFLIRFSDWFNLLFDK